MTPDERAALIAEQAEVNARMKRGFIDPCDMARDREITSLLLTNGETGKIRLTAGKTKNPRRVTPFTRNRT